MAVPDRWRSVLIRALWSLPAQLSFRTLSTWSEILFPRCSLVEISVLFSKMYFGIKSYFNANSRGKADGQLDSIVARLWLGSTRAFSA